MPEPLNPSLPKPDKPKNMVERVYVGASNVVHHRYEKHFDNYIKKRVIPELSGLPKELADRMRPRLELAARSAAVSRTTAEVVGVVAAFVGTVLLVKKAIDSRSPHVGLKQGMPIHLVHDASQLTSGEPPNLSDALFGIDHSLEAKMGAAVQAYDQRMIQEHPLANAEERGVRAFEQLITRFYQEPFTIEELAAFDRAKKTSASWPAQLLMASAMRYDRLFGLGGMETSAQFEGNKACVLAALRHAEEAGLSTGFLDPVWLKQLAFNIV